VDAAQVQRPARRTIDVRFATVGVLATGWAAEAVWAYLAHKHLEVLISAGAFWLSAVLCALAVRNQWVATSGRGALGPPQRVPAVVSGWLALGAFAIGMFVGREFWS
jgi:hypothetical protein